MKLIIVVSLVALFAPYVLVRVRRRQPRTVVWSIERDRWVPVSRRIWKK